MATESRERDPSARHSQPNDAPWPAPAKLNLFLHVLGRRPDGYHDLQTAFQFIDLCDELSFEVRPDKLIVRLEGPSEVAPADDLSVRAADQLRRHAAELLPSRAGTEVPGVTIRLRKRIPLQGGLGGGSSDAATTLVALNHLWGLELSSDELAQIGLKLGADVPVFVQGRAAWAEGVGERLEPLEPPESVYLVIRPGVAISTAEVFQAPELTRDSPAITIRAFLKSGGRNDCEPLVRKRFPAVAEALDWLGQFAPAKLTGTGSCIFAPFANREQAQKVAKQVPTRWQGFVVQGRNRSPLLDRLAAGD
ncbi:MAG TPA: 4-(cytidine 5'-diphospho)-2-C-methyl-D-erythritol kinase [Steroidobacteraceae bacterium]|nr:4-(cytidine 5'-diphospho)-2-C-methyl-D-erythritol kinase [Steroidobacteraceae bacterium]